jgi:hypothetical protein
MTTRFKINDIVLFSDNNSSYEFQILEIKIDESGIFYSGIDAGLIQVGWHKEKFLDLRS